MKEHEREELGKMEKLAAEIERNPLTKKFREDEAVLTLSKRQAAAEVIEALRKEQGEGIPKLQEAVKDKEAKYLKAKATLDVLFDECRTARVTLSSVGNSFDTAIRNQEAVLIESADPQIDAAITFFRKKLDYLRSPGRITRTGGKSERNLISWIKKTHGESNVQAVHDAMEYCQNAIKQLELLKLSTEFDIEKIEQLKKSIPAIDVFSEYTGQANMERQAPDIIEPCEYTLKKLLEKVNKHLKTPTKKARI